MMRKLGLGVLAMGLAMALAAVCASAGPLSASLQHSPQGNFLIDLLRGLITPDIRLEAEGYPEALPNDGRSESLISVHMLRDGKPLAGVKVTGQISAGDGVLRDNSAVTNDQGLAQFHYQAGLMPQPGVLNFTTDDKAVSAELKLPLAPISYLDVKVITPEEYAKLHARKAAAAPIYRLSLDGFPQQLAADGGSTSLLTASLSFTDGKPACGVPLKAELVSGEGSLRQGSQLTDSAGHVNLYFTAGRSVGTAIISVTEPSTGLSTALNILLVETTGVRVALVYKDPQTKAESHEGAILPADGVTGLPMVAQVSDLAGMPLSRIELRAEIVDNGDGRIEMQRPVSDSSGRVEFTYFPGLRTGTVRLRVFAVDGLPSSALGQ